MLIQCHRHTTADLALWRSLESADCLRARRRDFTRQVERALAAMEAFINAGPCYLGVSWGKDSVVVAHLLWQLGRPALAAYVKPAPTANPYSDEVRTAFLSRFYLPYVEIPVRIAADEEEVKALGDAYERGFRRAERLCGSVRYISGVRAEESRAREMRQLRWGESSPNTCAPITRWTTADVFAYLAHYDLPVHPNYAMTGGGRYERNRLRVGSLGGWRGRNMGRAEWETEYYGDLLREWDRRIA